AMQARGRAASRRCSPVGPLISAGPNPAKSRVIWREAARHILLFGARQVVGGVSGHLHVTLEGVSHLRRIVSRHRLEMRSEVALDVYSVEARGVESQHLPLVLLRELGVTILAAHVLRDLEAPHGIDLPLRR